MIRIVLLLLLTLTKGSYASDSAAIDIIKQVVSDQVGIPISQIDEDKPLSKQSIPADALDCTSTFDVRGNSLSNGGCKRSLLLSYSTGFG
jgi:hypothetical protein